MAIENGSDLKEALKTNGYSSKAIREISLWYLSENKMN